MFTFLKNLYTSLFHKEDEIPVWCKSKIAICINATIRHNPDFSITANSFIINWGDGNINSKLSHIYAEKQEYTVTITAINIVCLCIKQCGVTAIQLYNCKTLYILDCRYNLLKNLNIPDCLNLETLECSNNQLQDITITGKLDFLNRIFCDGNKLKTIDCKNLPALEILICKENHLNKLNVSGCRNLWRLDCQNNPISTDQIFNSLPKKREYHLQRIVTFSEIDKTGTLGKKFRKKGWYYYCPETIKAT